MTKKIPLHYKKKKLGTKYEQLVVMTTSAWEGYDTRLHSWSIFEDWNFRVKISLISSQLQNLVHPMLMWTLPQAISLPSGAGTGSI